MKTQKQQIQKEQMQNALWIAEIMIKKFGNKENASNYINTNIGMTSNPYFIDLWDKVNNQLFNNSNNDNN